MELYFDTHVLERMKLRKITRSQVIQLINSHPRDFDMWEDSDERDLFHIQSKTIRSPRSSCPLKVLLYKRGAFKTVMWKGEPDPA